MAKQVAKAASRALGLLITKFKAAGRLHFSTFTKLYNSTVMSIISYGASIWGCKQFSCVNAVQNRALRFFLGVGRYTPNVAVQVDTGWDSVYQNQCSCIMRQWYRIKIMDENRLNHEIYQWSIDLGNCRHKNWAYRVKSMMDDVNIDNNFDQLPANINKAYIIKKDNRAYQITGKFNLAK